MIPGPQCLNKIAPCAILHNSQLLTYELAIVAL
jgi:hypothetical protein